ncbi:hypothetical protein [Microbispora sp. GKU 823]|nr:hypothetical protein [Microbispora sp. GKU 823]
MLVGAAHLAFQLGDPMNVSGRGAGPLPSSISAWRTHPRSASR